MCGVLDNSINGRKIGREIIVVIMYGAIFYDLI